MNLMETIFQRRILLVGTTGDYNPMSFYNEENKIYKGFDIALTMRIANELDVKVKFIKTTWPTLIQQTLAGDFDIAISGISITHERMTKTIMTDGYLSSGKTILCRKSDSNKFKSLDDLNRPEVKIAVNPGGTNQLFIEEFCKNANIIIHEENSEIPSLILDNTADVMITDSVEAAFYAKQNPLLSAPLIEKPFTKNQFGILLKKENTDMLEFLNRFIDHYKQNGVIDELKKEFL